MRHTQLLVLFILLLLLAQCGSTRRTDEPAPEGIHLLTEVQVTSPRPDTVAYQMHIYAAGTQTCKWVDVDIVWPEEMREYVKEASWGIETNPAVPGRLLFFDGDTRFDLDDITPEQVRASIDLLELTVVCTDPPTYQRQVWPVGS
ncbi:MAG: hypothetical protein AAGF95_10525 [Chloroflexota bacterium]